MPLPSDEEHWLPIARFEGYYEVSDHGRVRAVFDVMRKKPAPRILGNRMKSSATRIPYWQVTLCPPHGRERGLYRHALTHQLVLETFVGPRPEGKECRHLDGNSDNNALSNLAWGTRLENIRDQIRHGTKARSNVHPKTKLTAPQVVEIRLLATTGTPRPEIAKRYEISRVMVGLIVRRLSWAHVL